MKQARAIEIAVCFLIFSNLSMGSDFLALPPDWSYEDEALAPVRAEVGDLVYQGARAQVLTLTARALEDTEVELKSPGVVVQTLQLNITNYRSLTFKARFKTAGKDNPEFTVILSGKNLSQKKVFSPDTTESGPDAEGFYSFAWNLGAPKSAEESVEFIRLSMPYTDLPPAIKNEVEIIDFAFARTGKDSGEAQDSRPVVPLGKWVDSDKIEETRLPMEGWQASGNGVTIESVRIPLNGKMTEAKRLIFEHAEKASLVTVPFPINTSEFNVFTMQAKVEVPAGAKVLGNREAPMTGWFSYQFNQFLDNFGISMETKSGVPWSSLGVPRTHFLQHIDSSAKLPDGLKKFVWDMKNQNPTGNKGFDLEEVVATSFFFDGRQLKPGEKVVITILDPKFIKGKKWVGGDPARMAEFEAYLDTYKPDYSDSSKYLGSPADGRLAEPLALIKGGKIQGEIVGESSVWTPEGNAVNELYHWLYRLTEGGKVPVTPKPSETDNVKIFVGGKYAKDLFPEDLAFLAGSDGSAIRTKGKNVYIFGATPKGTFNGVYAFLEGNSDIIWPFPSKGLDVVYTPGSDFLVTWGDYRHRPEARLWGWMAGTSGPQLDYQIRNRCNYVGIRSGVHFKYWGLYMEEGGGHNLHSWIPFSLWEKHPEYWAQIGGERQRPNGYKNQICLSNPEGRSIVVDRLLDYMEKNPQVKAADTMNIKIEDNWGSCECDECLRPIRLPDGSTLGQDDIAFRSTQFFLFLNSVANALHNQGFPKLKIGTYVYFFTVPVPKIPVTNFLRPYFCDYVRKDYKVPIFAPINDMWWRILNNWTAFNANVVMREYTGLFVEFRSIAEVAAFDIRAELDAGVREFTSESLLQATLDIPAEKNPLGKQMDASFLEYWIITRLYWDPEADVEQLRKYAIRRTFHEAAPAMEKFFGTIREIYFKEKRTSDFEENDETLRLALRQGIEPKLRGHLEEAARTVKHPISRQFVEQVKTYFESRIAVIQTEANG